MKKLHYIALSMIIIHAHNTAAKEVVKGTIAHPPVAQRRSGRPTQNFRPKPPIIREESDSSDVYISFSLIKERHDKEQGIYNVEQKRALTPDGRVFYNVIVQNNDKEKPTPDHILLGYYTRPGRSKIPYGVPTFAPVEQPIQKMYVFGIRVRSFKDLENSLMPTSQELKEEKEEEQSHRPEPRPMAIPFEINQLILEDQTQQGIQGTYIPAQAKAQLPDGRRYTDVIAQKEVKLAQDADKYTLLGTYQKEELYQKPKGGGTSIALHSSMVTYYLFGIQA